jgi:hypothetical protein
MIHDGTDLQASPEGCPYLRFLNVAMLRRSRRRGVATQKLWRRCHDVNPEQFPTQPSNHSYRAVIMRSDGKHAFVR